MKITHLVLSLNHGGMENGIVNVSSRLPHPEFSTHILCIREKGSMAKRLPAHCNVESLDYTSGFHIAGVWRIVRYLRQHQIDVLYTHNSASLTWGGLASLFCPGVTWIHGEHGYPKGVRTLKRLQQWLITKADRITAVSKNLEDETKKAYKQRDLQIDIIPNGVDTERFKPFEAQRIRTREALGFNNNDFILIVVGRLEDRKNQRLAIQALEASALSQSNARDVKLLFVGDGPDRSALEKLTEELGLSAIVQFLGFRDDVPALLQSADLLLLPSSKGEGMANVILEANACGVPAIASKIPGNTDLITVGFNGYLLEVDQPDSAQKWSELILDYIENRNEHRAFQLNSRLHVEQHFSMKKMISSYEQLYLSR